MKKIQTLILFAFLVACSPAPSPTTDPLITQPSVSPTQAAAPSFTPSLTITPTLTPLPTETSTAVPTPFGGGAGLISFSSEKDGVLDFYVTNADGSGLTNFAVDITPKINPVWAPDGTRVSFSSRDENSASLYIMNVDGTDLHKVLDTNDFDLFNISNPEFRFANPCCNSLWSPDGTKIVFEANYYIGCCYSSKYIYILNLNNNKIYTYKTTGSYFWFPDSQEIGFGYNEASLCGEEGTCILNLEDGKLSPLIKNGWNIGWLTWSPDNKKISFSLRDIYIMSEDDSNSINISQYIAHGNISDPVWAPDSKRIAFSSCDFSLCELFVANVDGTNPIKFLSQILGLDNIVWSLDSEKIVYVSTDSGNDDIYMVNSDGSNTVNLTNNSAKDNNPIWSPDGTKLAFVSNRDGNDEIYIMDIEDKSVFRLTNNNAKDFSPVWLP